MIRQTHGVGHKCTSVCGKMMLDLWRLCPAVIIFIHHLLCCAKHSAFHRHRNNTGVEVTSEHDMVAEPKVLPSQV